MEQVAADNSPPVAHIEDGGGLTGPHPALIDDLLAGRFFSIDVRGQVTGWNPRAESAFGWSTHHVSGMSLFEKLLVSGVGFGADDLEEFFAIAARTAAGRRVRALVQHQAGGQLPVELSIVPIQLAKAYELNAFLQDVSTSTASGVASELGRVREEHAPVLGMISDSLAEQPPAPEDEVRLAGALVVFHIDASAMTMMPPAQGADESSSGGAGPAPVAAGAVPVGTAAAEDASIARAEAERVRAQIDEAMAAAEEARAEAEIARGERDQLRARLEELESGAPEADAARADADTARAEAEELRARAAEVEEAAESSRAAAEDARREAERLRGELEGLRSAASGSQASAEQNAAELGAVRAELSQAQGDVERLGEELSSAQAELTAAREERDALRAELDELRTQVEAAEAVAGEVESLREQVEAAEAAAGSLEEARTQVSSLESELEAARTEAASAQDELAAARQRAEEIAAAAAAAREGGEAAEAAVAAAREEAHAAQAELAEARSRVEGLESELQAARAQAETARADLESLRDDAQAAQAETAAAREETETVRAELFAALEETEAARTETEEAQAKVEAASADAEKARAEVEGAREEAQTARAEVQTAREEVEAARSETATAREEAESARTEVETAREETEAARQQAEAAQAAAESARADAESARTDTDAAREETEAAKAELAAATERADAVAADLKAAQEEVASLRAELDAAHAQAESAGKTVGDAQAELGEARSEAIQARADAEKATADAEAARAAAEQAQNDADEAKTAASEAQSAADAARAEADEARAQLEKAREDAEGQLKAELEQAKAQAEEARTAAEQAQADADAARAEAEQAKADAEATRAEVVTPDEVEDHDPVTGLFNRRAFEEELSRHVADAARHGDGGAAVMLDLDHEELDAEHGEQLVKIVAEALKQNVSGAEMLAHLGGDEFAVLLPHADAAQAHKIAEHIVEAVGPQVIKVGDTSVRITVDVGVALFDERETGEPEVIEAERVTGPATETLPAPIEKPNPSASTYLAPADGVTDRVRRALAEDLFMLYAQPIIDLRTSEVTQYELLIRMQDDGGRLVLPDKFLPAAQQAGLMPQIDQWVVRHAIGLIHQAAQDGRRLMLEVNISSDSIDDPALGELIEAELDATGIDPRLLVIEVTEDAALAKIQETIKLSKWIRSIGCRFALDDFGSTFATVKYLKDMPVDYFKLDGDLIVTLPESRTNQLLLNALMDVARGTGTQTIAVYVPDDETLVMLRQYGIGYGQGNRVGRPRPVAEI